MEHKILIIGSLNMDIRIGLSRIPVLGETVRGDSLVCMPGGKGANQACAAGRLGNNAVMLGSIGADDSGTALISSLKRCGVDTAYLKRSDRNNTGTAVIYVEETGDNSIAVYAGANSDCDVGYLRENDRLFRECSYIVLQMEIPYDAVRYAAKRGRELRKTVILNPAPAPDEMPEGIYENIDYLTPNETELMKLTGIADLSEENLRKGAQELLAKGVGNVIVTLGDKGCCRYSGSAEEYIPAVKTKAIDTTAAGDCFNGAFAVGLSEGMNVSAAAGFANAAASIVVTRKGAQDAIPSREEVRVIAERNRI